jgi:hypothetical protein
MDTWISISSTAPVFRLYRNNGDLTFTDVTEKAGLGGAGYGMGVAVGDYDNDGWPDLFVANVNGNQLFHNNGDGTFTDVTRKAGVGGGFYEGKKMSSVAAAWLDYNNDGLLDLFVSNYCRLQSPLLPAASQHALPQQWRWHVHRRLRPDRHCGTPRARHGSGCCRLRWRWLPRHLRG